MGGSCATARSTSSGWAAASASRFTGATLVPMQSTGADAERLDHPVQVLGVLLGRYSAVRVGLRADRAVVGDDRGVGE